MIILNERIFAEECLSSSKTINTLFPNISILAKYYYHCKEYRKRKIIKALTEYVSVYYPAYKYEKTTADALIESAATKAGRHPLHEIDGVWITKSELDKIAELHNKVLERLTFTLLCLAKLGNQRNAKNNGWVNNDIKEIFDLARIFCNVTDKFRRINTLYNAGYIKLPKQNDKLSYRVTYIDDNSDKVLYVSDFRELGYEYMKYKGENITHCQECGVLFRNNKTHPRKYCKSCAGYTPQQTKAIECVDCGRVVIVNAKNNQTVRCADCRREYRSLKSRQNMQTMRSKQKMLSAQF